MWNTLKRIGNWLDEILNTITMDQLTLNALADIETLRAQLAQAEIELADKAFYVREFAALSVERDNLKAELAALRERPSVAPTDDQVEALARVLEDATAEGFEEEHKTYMRRLARVAIAHLAKRPEGLPTAEELARLSDAAYCEVHDIGGNWEKRCPEHRQGEIRAAEAILAALRPWLRDPVGWELDVTAEELTAKLWGFFDADKMSNEIIDLCRKRIRPVYECKECKYKQSRIHRMEGWVGALEGHCDDMRKLAAKLPARAALEGE